MLGWVHLDLAVRVVSDLGLGFLLFLAGFEIESSQLRVRLAITLPLAFGVLAEHFGLATILGAFLAGIILGLADESSGAPLTST